MTTLTIPEDAWVKADQVGEELHTQVTVNGIPFHVTAQEATYSVKDGFELQLLGDMGDDLDRLVPGDGHFRTVIIRNREYVLVVTPHRD